MVHIIIKKMFSESGKISVYSKTNNKCIKELETDTTDALMEIPARVGEHTSLLRPLYTFS